MKKMFNYWFGTKNDAKATGFFAALSIAGGGISWLAGAPWWLIGIIAIVTPALFSILAVLFFAMIIKALLGG